MKTIIKYKRWRLIGDLILGVAWALFFAIGLDGNYENIKWNYYFYFLISIIYLSKYLYESHHQYLIIDDETMTKPNPFHTQKINISDIKRIKTFACHITFCGKDMEIEIAKNVIDKESYENLKIILQELGFEDNLMQC